RKTENRRGISHSDLDGAATAFAALARSSGHDLNAAARLKPEDQAADYSDVKDDRKDQPKTQAGPSRGDINAVGLGRFHCFFSVGSVTRLTSAPDCLATSST